jgi:hypothetical protein
MKDSPREPTKRPLQAAFALAGFSFVWILYSLFSTASAGACTYEHWRDGCSPSPQTYVVRRFQTSQYAHTYLDWWVYDAATNYASANSVFTAYDVLPIAEFQYTAVEADAEVHIRHGNYCPPDSAGCLLPGWIDDTTRNGKYLSGADIRLQTYSWTYTTNGWKFVVAHELGHFMGLEERLNQPESSVMDYINCSGPCSGCTSTNKCAAAGGSEATLPTAWDKDRIREYYRPHDANCNTSNTPACPGSIAEPRVELYLALGGRLTMEFWDTSTSEDRYDVYWYRWNGSAWVSAGPGTQDQPYTGGVGDWGRWRGEGSDSDPSRDIYPTQDGWYTVCLYTLNKAYGTDDGIDELAYRCGYPSSGVYVDLP